MHFLDLSCDSLEKQADFVTGKAYPQLCSSDGVLLLLFLRIHHSMNRLCQGFPDFTNIPYSIIQNGVSQKSALGR